MLIRCTEDALMKAGWLDYRDGDLDTDLYKTDKWYRVGWNFGQVVEAESSYLDAWGVI
jgi:hypothetical protein